VRAAPRGGRRSEHRLALERDEPFDLLIIGGGASGTGAALDAVTRGLTVALVERDDLSAGTSSRSTKLIHGGVRYLEKAVKGLDRTQFALVRDALRERAVLLRNAPHLCHALPLVTPLYSTLQVPYIMTGLKMYDWLAGRENLHPSRFVNAREAKRRFPQLKAAGLRGGVIYYDGQFDDARMNVAIALSAAERGAVIVTHAEVTAVHHDGGRIAGVTVLDRASGERAEVAARAVVNATGPYADAIRRLDDPGAEPMLSASSGVHIVLDERFAPPDTGLLIPKTEDGRVLFLLPWLGSTLVGTTDQPAPVVDDPEATEEEIEYILRHLGRYFDLPVARADVKAAWSGLRPLVADPKAADTARLSRDHVVHVSGSGLVTIAGGKWTTYRRMAPTRSTPPLRRAGSATGRRPRLSTSSWSAPSAWTSLAPPCWRPAASTTTSQTTCTTPTETAPAWLRTWPRRGWGPGSRPRTRTSRPRSSTPSATSWRCRRPTCSTAAPGWGSSMRRCEMPLALEPRGPAAAEIARIWWLLFWTATIVSIIVFVLLGVALVRARARAREEDAEEERRRRGHEHEAPERDAPASWLEGRTTGSCSSAAV
jgi:glycerol-3-phosphate dehydrogenase